MSVDGGVAMTREMFRRGKNAVPRIRMRAFDKGAGISGNIFWRLAKRANVDNWIIRIVVYVGDRKEYPMHAQRSRLTRGDFSFEAGRRRIARGGKRHGVRKYRCTIHPHGSAALEIPGHEQRDFGQFLHAVQKSGERVGLRSL